jgi:hypothetical protein
MRANRLLFYLYKYIVCNNLAPYHNHASRKLKQRNREVLLKNGNETPPKSETTSRTLKRSTNGTLSDQSTNSCRDRRK